MKITGFTIVRNAIKYDYPVVEAITSILPLCDDFIVLLGNSDDETLALIKSIDSPKIRIIDSVWDDSMRAGGKVLAVETNKAMQYISADTTWAFYMQADEVLHEKYFSVVQNAMQQYASNQKVDGLLFKYTHFYGSPNYVADSRRWYRQEIRIIKPSAEITSYEDAQGFRKTNNEKLRVKAIDAHIYHYGWLKSPEKMIEKLKGVCKFWMSDDEIKQKFQAEAFDYTQIDSLNKFSDTHPKVMTNRLASLQNDFDFDIKQKKYSFRFRILHLIENLTGYRVGEYRNFRLV